MNEILARVEEQNKIQKSEAGISVNNSASRAVSAMKNINLPQIKDKVLDLPEKFRDFKFWPRAHIDARANVHTKLDSTTSLSALKHDYYQNDGGYMELKWIWMKLIRLHAIVGSIFKTKILIKENYAFPKWLWDFMRYENYLNKEIYYCTEWWGFSTIFNWFTGFS